MAKAYYFDYIGASDAFKNSTVEANTVGNMFLECVYTTLKEYGVKLDMHGQCKDYTYRNNDRYRGFIFYYKHKSGILIGGDDSIDVILKTDNKLIVDFKVDPLTPENSNNEIIEDIRKKAEAAHLITNTKAIETSSENSHDSLSMDRPGGCYVATAVYGSYDCPEVWTLRRFRDLRLSQSWYGRVFIKIYYTVSPTLVRIFGETDWFKCFWKNKLDKLVISLKQKGFDDSPYND